MKQFLCLIIFFIGFCDCADEDTVAIPKNYWSREVDDYNDKAIRRPCPRYDLNCVRNYFEKNARCSPTYGKVPDPLHVPQMSLPVANANFTFVLTNAQIKGLNGKVVEFYVNKLTDKVVLAVELRELTIFSSEAFFRFQRKAKEPVVTSDFTIVTYSSVTLTAVLPNTNDLQLHKAETNAFIDDTNPRYSIGPNAYKSKDPIVQQSMTQLATNVNEIVREAFIVQAPIFMNLFIQNRICDFGLKVYSY